MPNDVPRLPTLTELLTQQDSVVARWQLSCLASVSRVRRRVRKSLWQSPYDGVFVAHNGPLTRQQRLWMAVLSCGAGAVLTRATAAELEGLRGYEEDAIHVTVGRTRGVVEVDGATIHRSRHTAGAVHPAHQLRRVVIEHAVVEMAAYAKGKSDTNAILCAAVQQRLTTATRLREFVTPRRTLPRRALILETLTEIDGGAQSINEVAVLRLFRRAGLPRPTLQVHAATARRRAYIDGGWPSYGVWYEVDGEFHRDVRRWRDDLDRHNELSIGQHGVRLRWAGFDIRHCAARVADQARRALLAAGWNAA